MEKFIPIAVVFILGFALKKIGVLKRGDSHVIGAVLLNIVIPAAIAGAFATISLEPKLLSLPFVGGGIVLVLLGIGYALANMLRLEGGKRGAFIISFPTFEGGTIGYALMFAIFGEAGLSRIALFDFGNAFLEFSLIYSLAVILGGQTAKNGAVAASIIKILKTPIIWAMAAGIALNLAGVGGNQQLQNVFNTIGAALVPLVMLLLGLEFEPKTKMGLPLFAFAAKLTAGFCLGLAAATVFGFQGLEKIAVIVGATLPTSLLAIVFAEENNLDSGYVASLVAFAIPAYLALFGLATAVGLL